MDEELQVIINLLEIFLVYFLSDLLETQIHSRPIQFMLGVVVGSYTQEL